MNQHGNMESTAAGRENISAQSMNTPKINASQDRTTAVDSPGVWIDEAHVENTRKR